MFHFKTQQLYVGYALAFFSLTLMMLQPSSAELKSNAAPINNLYDNLLQREYAGPVVFPNHQVERKAQRSPSLRLRFGRSDPDMLNNIVEKRWFGDVNQKPIRSPSLRLRFGRRSDPNLPQMRRTAYDDLLERELTLNSQQQQPAATDDAVDYDSLYERVVRKPQRLRWGRSVPQYEAPQLDNEQLERNELYNSLLSSEKMRRMLMALQQYESAPTDLSDTEEVEDDQDTSEFQREARKPMRLRWGRSTGKAPTDQEKHTAMGTSDETSPTASATKIHN
ncbi:short neuropeptide F [Drosophila tropicalis]|uniref:short neuropeptide F n=1 Tax=Drosophila tropicalis TaxID=46794 RepID=UPI0035AB94A3